MIYHISRTEEISRKLELDIEAPSEEEAKEIFSTMCYTGEFYDEAETTHEELIENWDEMSYVDPASGETCFCNL